MICNLRILVIIVNLIGLDSYLYDYLRKGKRIRSRPPWIKKYQDSKFIVQNTSYRNESIWKTYNSI